MRAVEAGGNAAQAEPVHPNPLQILKIVLTIAAGAVVVTMIAVEVAVAVVAIQFFTIFAGY